MMRVMSEEKAAKIPLPRRSRTFVRGSTRSSAADGWTVSEHNAQTPNYPDVIDYSAVQEGIGQ